MSRGAVVRQANARRWGFLIALGLAALVMLWATGGARAATTLTVTSTADDAGTTACTNGQCPTLRDAVNQANKDSGDTIILPALSPQPYALTNGEIVPDSDMTIEGAGASQVTIDAANNGGDRVFEIESSTVTISGVTITEGGGASGFQNDPDSGDGGGIYVDPDATLMLTNSTVSDNTGADGGGIYVSGTLNLQGSTVTGNQALAEDPGEGGGIYVDETATITNSTVTGNSANFDGGGIYNDQDLTLTNSTVSDNTAPDGGGLDNDEIATIVNSTITGNRSSEAGGGIYDDDTLNLTNVTLSGNSAPEDSNGEVGGANLFVDDTGAGGFQNTIISNPQGGGTNCYTSGEFPASGGHNLEDDAGQSCDFTDPSDQSGVDPKLGPLANNGGPTQTMALLAGSPAIDKGATIASVTTDQRGGPRPQPPGGAYDIGAYEASAVVDMAITKSASPSPATTGAPLAYTLKATNNGPTADPGYAVTVKDSLPSGETFSSASASQGSCSNSSGTVTCNLGTVAEGATVTITIIVTPTGVGSVTNTATVSSSALDPNTANNSASATTQVNAASAAAGTKPQATTGDATGITFTGATVHGTVNPDGASTIYYFQYGTGGDPVTTAGVAGSGTSNRAVSAHLKGLKPGTLYHYRLVAQNSHGTVDGRNRTFRTPPRPSIHVAPSRVRPGALVRVFGSAGACSVGDTVTLLSHAFSGAHQFAGVPAISARVRSGHSYSTTTQIPSGRAAGHYLVTARCGGGNLGVSAALTVFTPVVPKFTG